MGYTDRKRQREANRKYRLGHCEKVREKGCLYYIAHRKEILRKARLYRAIHAKNSMIQKRDRTEYGVRYRATHRKERAIYEVSHKSEKQARKAIRRALKTGVVLGATAIQLIEIKEIYRRAKEDKRVRCYLCGRPIPLGHRHVDHIMPLSKNGKHRPSNLAVACNECNLKKYNRMPEEIGLLF